MVYQICVECVMDTSDPDILFDDHGVCNHCKNAKTLLQKHWFPNEIGKELLDDTARDIQQSGKGKNYNCIVGVSGGIDSSYLLHLVKVEMKLDPLVVHVDAGWNSDEAVHNIQVMVNKLGLKLITHQVDWEEMKDLQKAYLRSSLANQDVPQDHAFFAKLYEIACKHRIKYVITGGNLTSESILPSAWGHDAMDSIQLRAIHKKFGKKRLKNYPIASFFKSRIYYPYIYKMKVVRPLDWIDYNKNKAIDFLEKEYGWKYYGGKHFESRWTRFFQAYYLSSKFGIDKRRAHLSSMIAAGQLTRSEAVVELATPPYTDETAKQDIHQIASALDICVEELNSLIALPIRDFAHYPNQIKYQNFFRAVKNLLRHGSNA